MESCTYCGASYPEEADYLEHLVEDHNDDLGRIDTKRIEDHPEVTFEQPPSTAAMAIQTLILFAGLAGSVLIIYLVLRYNLHGGAL